MAQLQFRPSDDTIGWPEKFGNGTDGVLTISGDTTEAPIDSACTGALASNSLSATSPSFTSGQIVFIYQTQGTGAGNWQLNVIDSYVVGTVTTKYKLTNNYVTGAQVRVVNQNANITINSGTTLTVKGWNGTVGGLLVLMSNGTTSVLGNIRADAGGFAGGTAQNSGNVTYTGEGTAGSPVLRSTSANGNGGSAAWSGSAGSSGGGNGTAGQNGYGGTQQGGLSVGNTSLTVMCLGGGAGGMSRDEGSPSGGNGGAIVVIISPIINVSGAITSTGQSGGFVAPNEGSGSGAGGSILFKGQTISLGSSLVTANGGPLIGQVGHYYGGAGGDGRIHADYSTSFSGTTSPSMDLTLDNGLNTLYGGGIF